jgi:hypothetical protein
LVSSSYFVYLSILTLAPSFLRLDRFTDLYNLPPGDRKDVLKDLRVKESAVGRLFSAIAGERLRRRAREFALRALGCLRHGRRLEQEEAERQAAMERQRLEAAAAKAAKAELVAGAMAVDRKWIRQDRKGIKSGVEDALTMAEMGYHPGYGAGGGGSGSSGSNNNKGGGGGGNAAAEREHPYSWRPAHFDEKGTPMTVEGAAAVSHTMRRR